MKKRGQAAMEFLMTYGWAILAAIISIIALAYFGVLNPAIFLPESCTLIPGLACTDFVANKASITLTVINGMGVTLNPFTLSIQGCSQGTALDGLRDGEKEVIAISCNNPSLLEDTKFKSDIDIIYKQTSLTHNLKGSLVTRVENDYVMNSGFELGISPWQVDVGCGIGVRCMPDIYSGTGSIDTTEFISGSSSYKLEVGPTPHPDPHYPYFSQTSIIALPAGTYEISFFAKASANGFVGYDFTDSITIICEDLTLPVTTSWTKFTRRCTITTPIPNFAFFISHHPTNQILWVDDVKIKKV